MIPHGLEIFVSLDPVDLRWSFDRLASIVEGRMGRPPRSGALFVFFNKRRTSLKVLFFDGTGLCIFYKRLDKNTFRLPTPADDNDTTIAIEQWELDVLLDGLSIDKTIKQSQKKVPTLH